MCKKCKNKLEGHSRVKKCTRAMDSPLLVYKNLTITELSMCWMSQTTKLNRNNNCNLKSLIQFF